MMDTQSPQGGWMGAEMMQWPMARLWQQAADYGVDAWQRSVLYADVMRQRGNQYQEHLRDPDPHVLDFQSETILLGSDLPRPVNYGLLRIVPASDQALDETKRPFVVVDPRAGHGPGIGGFKAESEIGIALAAGHPCYFIGFGPEPVPGQTVEDVMRAEAAFLEQVIARHPRSSGKPVVIGNCQAGWQVLMTAAMRPELFGPIIVAGAPLSYWAGWEGKNPMRYTGGLLGGSTWTQWYSDIGNGRFDGASLVMNFENLNPANTLWSKQYNLYAKVDTEPPRYLNFEKYWGGYVYMDGGEMQYIVDNLFVGNRLSRARLITSDGVRLDLRKIRSPIVVFCSRGDNITPPPQALGWICDLYHDDADILSHDQTIVYAMHESIGHLGIFVSSSVARKEHREFAANIELIDLLPPGLFEAVVEDVTERTYHPDLTQGDYVMSLRRRRMDDIRAIVQPDPESDRRFAAAARVSDLGLGMYRQFVQPWVRAMVSPVNADLVQKFHPMRIQYEWWSDHHPLAPLVRKQADAIRAVRRPADPDNPWLHWQEAFSQAMVTALDTWRDVRDHTYEQTFKLVYGAPWMQAFAYDSAADMRAPLPTPCDSPEHAAFVAETLEDLLAEMHAGGLQAAAIRALFYIFQDDGEIDERMYNLGVRLYHGDTHFRAQRQNFRDLVRRQSLLLQLDEKAALAAIPGMLEQASPASIRKAGSILVQLIGVTGRPSVAEARRLQAMVELFAQQADLLLEAEAAAALEKAAAKPAPARKRAAPAKAARRKSQG